MSGPDLSLSALVLCGGQSRRMGKPKAFLDVGGGPLIGRVIAVARAVASEVLLVAADAEPYRHLGLPVVTGERPGLGPLEALRAGLEAARGEWIFALACDLPGLEPEPLRKMFALSQEADAVIPQSVRGLEPLCALYHRRCRQALGRAIEAGERAPHRALGALRVVHPSQADLGAPPGFFDNLNTPEDLAGWSG